MTPNSIARFERYFIKEAAACWLWQGAHNASGYGYFYYLRKLQPAHRVAWMLYKDRDPGELFVLHRCDVRDCVNPKHLFLGDHNDNMRDMAQKSRAAKGDDNGNSKLSSEAAEAIRKDSRGSGVIAREHGITREQVWNIRTGRQRKHANG